MGFQDIVGGRLGCNYEKLAKSNEKVGRPERQQWVKKMNGRPKGFRLSRSWKLTLKIFSVVVWTSRITRICSDIVNRMKVDVAYPTIIFSSQRGLPVLFHPSVRSCSIKYCSPKLFPYTLPEVDKAEGGGDEVWADANCKSSISNGLGCIQRRGEALAVVSGSTWRQGRRRESSKKRKKIEGVGKITFLPLKAVMRIRT
ncbi:hypothetical protein ACFX1T_010097 [Malus domestica]